MASAVFLLRQRTSPQTQHRLGPTPQSPGNEFEFQVPDMYDRPWARIWEQYHEEGMEKPDSGEDIFSFE